MIPTLDPPAGPVIYADGPLSDEVEQLVKLRHASASAFACCASSGRTVSLTGVKELNGVGQELYWLHHLSSLDSTSPGFISRA